jgi:uncharacterized SAM-binding protein YcdF (DUF218 family)
LFSDGKYDKIEKIRGGVVVILFAVLLVFVMTGVAIMTKAQGSSGEFDYLLVLGTKVQGTEPTSILRDRIHAAYTYLNEHPDVICIVSGYQSGKGEISEAECMKRELVKLGVDPLRIWKEEKASSTVENLEFTLALIEEKTGSRPDVLGILSTESHLLRAEMFAKRQGIRRVLLPAKTCRTSDFLVHLCREIIMVWYYSIIHLGRKRK